MSEAVALVSEDRVRAYLERLGVERPAPTLEGLRALHEAHLRTIPFENLSIHLGEPIVLETDALVEKILDRGRGGFCYELNGAFAWLLRTLGFDVQMLAARVVKDDGVGRPFDHMCLRVNLDEPWLADVGFGDHFLLPIRLDSREDQVDAAGTFRIIVAEGGHLDLLRDGVPQYRFDLTPHGLADYEVGSRYHQTSPESTFTQNTVCSRVTPDGRITISGHTLVETRHGQRTERALDDAELVAAYREHFEILLDRVPTVRPRPAAVPR